MNAYRQWRRAILGAILLATALAAWIIFAPFQLGGQAAYVIVDGNSMEPGFQRGDLVVVHGEHAYATGEIVTYWNADMQRYVFHRIIGTQGNHFILRGDHNTWDDSYHPVPGDLVGRYWFSLPRAGNGLLWLRQPLNMGLMAGLFGGLFVIIMFQRRTGNENNMKKISMTDWLERLRQSVFQPIGAWYRQMRQLRHDSGIQATSAGTPEPSRPVELRSWGTNLEILFFALGLIFFASLILGYFAFTHPLQRQVDTHVPYQHLGTFSYSAPAPAGIYDSRSVQSGDPIFPGLTCLVDMRFSYALAGLPADKLTGTYQLVAKIIDVQSGWQRTLPLTKEEPFSGGSFIGRAPIDLCQIEALVSSVEQTTGLASSNYVLRLAPVVTLNGTVGKFEFKDTFKPQLDFRFDRVLFSMQRDDPEKNPLNPTQAADFKNTIIEANTLSILGREFVVGRLRLISMMGLLLSLIGITALGVTLSSMIRASQVGLVQLKYGSLIVEATEKNLDRAADTVEITSVDDLARLAEKHNTVILAQERNGIHYYSVRGGGRTYRYAVSEWMGGTSSVPLVELEGDLRKGLEQGEFEVYYQPILSLADGKIYGVEALLRWHHPRHGLVPAAQFLPAAEASGLMTPIGDWLLGVACQQVQDWRRQGLPLSLSINLSEQELMGDPAAAFRRVVQSTGVDPHCLQIEVPGPAMMELPQDAIYKLEALKELGVQISVEESGGTSALSSIFQFPLTGIKIERAAVERIIDRSRVTGVHRMIEAAHGRGLQIGAVGVETQEQMDFLRSERCNYAQGYLVGRPASAEQLSLSLLGRAERHDGEHAAETAEPPKEAA